MIIHLNNQEYTSSPHWGLPEGTTLKEWLILHVCQEVCWLKKMHNVIVENYVLVSGYTKDLSRHLVKAVVFPVVIYGYESWTINKAECQRIDAFKAVVLEKTLESPLDCTEIEPVSPKRNQPWISTLNIHWKDWCYSWSSNTLATWFEELTHWRRPWCWERLRAGGEGGDRGWDGWMASPTRWTWIWANSGRWWRTGKPGMWQSMGS